jgi:hypothetical protein
MHRRDQPDHRHQVGDPVHRAGQRLADHRGVGGEARSKLGRRLTLDPGQVGARQMGEHAALQLTDHQQDDLLDLHVLEILRQRLHRGHGDDQRRELVENPPVVLGEHLEGVIDHHRIQRGGTGHQQRQQQDQQEPRLVMPDVLTPQPT